MTGNSICPRKFHEKCEEPNEILGELCVQLTGVTQAMVGWSFEIPLRFDVDRPAARIGAACPTE